MFLLIFTICSLAPFLLSAKPKNIWLFLPPTMLLLTPLSFLLSHSPLNTPKYYRHFILDPISTPLISLSLLITALMILASTALLTSTASSPSLLSAWSILLALFLSFSFSSDNMLMFYIFFESTLIPTAALILGWGHQPERLQASYYFLLYTVLASLPLLTATMATHHFQGHISFLLPWDSPPLPPSLTSLWWLMINAAFLVKLPLFISHLWLPKAHVEAPVAGSMVLAAILLKLGGYGLIRMALLLPSLTTTPNSIMAATSLWGAMITALICLRQTDLKALIAYSSVSHMGLLISGTMTKSLTGISGALATMIAHGLSSSGLFVLANLNYSKTNSRSLFLSKGMASLLPNLTFWWLLFSATNMATPPSLNLMGEIFLFSGIISMTLLSVGALTLISFLTAAYTLYLYTSTQHGVSPYFSSPFQPLNSNDHSTLLLHLIPLTALILKPELFTPL